MYNESKWIAGIITILRAAAGRFTNIWPVETVSERKKIKTETKMKNDWTCCH